MCVSTYGIRQGAHCAPKINYKQQKVRSKIWLLISGAKGFEPLNAWTKTRCLTAWLRPNILYRQCSIILLKLRLKCQANLFSITVCFKLYKYLGILICSKHLSNKVHNKIVILFTIKDNFRIKYLRSYSGTKFLCHDKEAVTEVTFLQRILKLVRGDLKTTWLWEQIPLKSS